ncbi:sugar transferase [Adlercreutzia caecimuris]|uniref:sugar transferase n=1 Tax=Adlercreutzia caecimuris TaxID=671266 RepID=UPI002494B157|nr:sugar transferase [Adlercreutzia caecimuris]
MRLVSWDALPDELRVEEVRPYYDSLVAKKGQLVGKRCIDIVVSALLLVLLSPVFLVLAIAIKVDSPGPVFYRQERVTQYGKKFRIFKFRTMCDKADQMGSAVTTGGDARVTRVGAKIRDYRLDEISQLIDILRGAMTLVGTRPEVPKYVAAYTPEMMATLLLPAGVTSTASVRFKDEAELLDSAADVDKVYVEDVLPAKMKYNLRDVKEFSLPRDIRLMFQTVGAVANRGE